MLISIGYGNSINIRDIVAVVQPDSSPIKKLRRSAETERMLVNATGGRKVRSVIIMSSNHVILSALQTTTLKDRIQEEGNQNERRNGL